MRKTLTLLALLTFTLTAVSQATKEYVDLGLSVKWATTNVGASSPEEYGAYFAWGEYNNKDDYDWTTYRHCYGTSSTLTKYCNKSSSGYNGYTDSKTVLDPEDDMAHANWGGDWRTPTAAEWTELMDSENCTWTWTSRNDVYGYEVTSKKPGFTGNSIFLPAAWCMIGNTLDKNFARITTGTVSMQVPARDTISFVQSDLPVAMGYYWSSSLYEQNPSRAYFISFTSGDNIDINFRTRYTGLSVRPVCFPAAI